MPTPKPSKLARIRALVASRQQFTARSETERDYCYPVSKALGVDIVAWQPPLKKNRNGKFEILPVLSEKEKQQRGLKL